MESVEVRDDANAIFAELSTVENVDIIDLEDQEVEVIDPEEAAMDQAAPDDQEEAMPDEVETARGEDDTVMEHAAQGEDEPEVDMDSLPGGGDETMADEDEGNTRDTLPMYEEGEEGVATVASEGMSSADAEMKEESPSTEGENSLLIPDDNGTTTETSAVLPSTFPHCFVCGFDRETVLMKEKKGNSGTYRNKVIYRNRCVRKPCSRFFGPSYIWDGKLGEFVRSAEETVAANRPFIAAPREEKYPDIDYERAAESGVRIPIETNGAWLRGGTGAVAAAAAAGGGGGTKIVVKPPATPSGSVTPQNPSTPNGTGSPAQATTAAAPRTAAATAARVAAAAAKAATAALKKPRKGYQWVTEPDPNAQPSTSQATVVQKARPASEVRPRVQRRTTGSQTGDIEQVGQFVVEEIRTKAVFKGMRKDEMVPMSGSISTRLFLTQKTMAKQMKEITQLRSERDSLRETLKKFTTTLGGFRQDVMSDMQRLKEDVGVANRELKSFAFEMQNEADKDIRYIKKIKEEIAKRIDDTDRYRRKIEASLEYQQGATKEETNRGNMYHRMCLDLEHKIAIAKLESEDAKEKLNDKIYLTNNAKCAHCQVNEKIKDMLTEQIAEKTMSANNLGKERQILARKLENSEKIQTIVSKENAKLKFELRAWETNCHRMKAELQALRGNTSGVVVLPPSLPSTSIGEAAFTPQSTTMKDADGVTPDRGPLDDVMEDERPPATASNLSANSVEEGEYKSPSPNTLAKLPPPPAPPAKLKDPSPELLDNAFASWIPKERKPQEMPAEMAEALRRVGEALEKGPPPKKEKKEEMKEREREKGKRTAGAMPPQHPSSSAHKNGEKKQKMEENRVKTEAPPPRPIPSLSGGSKGPPPAGILQKMADREKEKRIEERNKESKREPSPIPFTSTHEPAFPAVVAPKKAVTVPYNGPSSLMASSSSSASSSPAPPVKQNMKTPEKKKPMSFLPVAGSTGMLPPPTLTPGREPPRPVPVDAILREAERLRDIERERNMRRERDRERQAIPRNDPYYDYELNAAAAAAADRRERMQPVMAAAPPRFDFDDDLPWNQGRTPQPSYQRTGRSRTPTQDWFYEAPASHAPPPRQPSPRYYDDPRAPLPPRDAYGRPMEMEYGRHPQQPHPQPLMQQPLAPPHRVGGPPPGDVWRRDWHDTPWSEEPPRRSYWE